MRNTLLLTMITMGTMACAAEPSGPPAPITGLPRALTVAEGEVVQRSNRFAFDLMRRSAAARDSNVFISPLSVSMALGMTLNGAANATLDSMRAALGFEGMPLADLNAGYRGLIDLLLGIDRTTEMRIANAVWYRTGLSADADFRDALLASFDARVQALDFGLPTAPDTMNRWASSATNGRIPQIVDAIDPETVMFLMNAVYFKAKWVDAFDPRKTSPGAFMPAFGNPQQVPMMRNKTAFDVLQSAEVNIAELRYGNEAFVVDLVLPGATGDIHDLIDSLTPQRWSGWMASLQRRTMDLVVPKFTLEYERSLNDDLAALGMGIAFVDGAADFRNLFEPNQPGPFISAVKHKTFVEVNEAGTEAAAVTSVGVEVTSLPPSFTVNEPFLLVIRERFSGTILFMGKILRVPE